MEFSFYPNHNQTVPTSNTNITEFLNNIKNGVWKDVVEQVRNAANDKDKKAAKDKLPGFTISGTFTERKESGLTQHSGFLSIDIDKDVSKFEKLKKDPYTFAVFKSASGNGLVVIVRIKKEHHKESFDFLRNYYFDTYKILIDPAPQNVASLRYVSFDPDLFINEKSKLSSIQAKKEHKIKEVVRVYTGNTFENLINEICSKKIDIAPDYDSFLKLGFALASEFGKNGLEYFDSLCSINVNYNSNDVEKQFNECLKDRKKGVTIGTFYYLAQSAGIELPKGNQKALNGVLVSKKSGLAKELTAQNLVNQFEFEPNEATEFVNKVYSNDNLTLAKVCGDPENLVETLIYWIASNYNIKKNIYTYNYEVDNEVLTKEKLNSIYLAAKQAFNVPQLSFELVFRTIISENTPTFNPFHDFYNANKHRKTSGNIEKLINCIHSKTPNYETYIKKWLTSLHSAINYTHVRLILAFIGGQNMGKTTLLRELLPKELLKYYADSTLEKGKDDELLMTQKLIILIDEFEGDLAKNIKKLKMLSSKDVFSIRPPYGICNEDFKRIAVLCITSNESDILRDSTGNTRILPVQIDSLDLELFKTIDKAELFMETFRLYESGFNWQLTKEELLQLGDTGKDFESVNYEKELILKYFAKIDNKEVKGNVVFMTPIEILLQVERLSEQTIRDKNRFFKELRCLFGKTFQKKIKGINQLRYELIEIC